MYKRKTKPDLMFLLTVFVCLGVLVTATVKASESAQPGWSMTIKADQDCQKNLGEWQACAGWQGLAGNKSHGQGATLRFFHEQRPELDVVWYYSKPSERIHYNINDLYEGGAEQGFAQSVKYNSQFGVALRQQYRHFGFSVGVESERAQPLNDEAILYFGISNRW